MKLWKLAAGSIALCVMLSACGQTNENKNTSKGQTYQYTDFVMDTVLSETIYGATKDYTADLQDTLKTLEEEELSWRLDTSELAKINDALKKDGTCEMSEAMSEWMNASLKLAKDSDGAFDPTIGELAKLWNIEGENPTVPEADKIKAALKEIGYDAVKCEGNTINIEETRSIDLGAAGKGIACDAVYEYLAEKEDVTGAVVAVGGSVVTYGEKEDGSTWNVAIQDPDAEDGSAMGVLHLTGNRYISTSGDYEKYFIENGKRYHHILDPKSGYPTDNGLSSVTILCDNGLLSDALSTACFILGQEESEVLLKEYKASAVFIDHEGKVTLVGDEAMASFEVLNDNYEIQ